jgi:hypothetical protein
MLFKPLKDNSIIITFTSKGDYLFVEGGGPWIHQGVVCLIAPFVNNAQPSKTVERSRCLLEGVNRLFKNNTDLA